MNLTANDHRIPLNDGNSIPIIGLGTYSDIKTKDLCTQSVMTAIDIGYRHIDGALAYGNEHEVGKAIHKKMAEGKVKREDIFYCGKLWPTFFMPEMVRPALEETLNNLQLDYIDLYIIETPMALKPGNNLFPKDENGHWIYHDINLCKTWEVECHPYFIQTKLLKFCQSHDIVIVAYSPLGTARTPEWVNLELPPMLKDPLLISLGKKYNKSPAQISLRFNVQRGIVVIPKSFDAGRIKENFQIFDFMLTDEDMQKLEALNKNIRFVLMKMWTDHPEYPFHDEY
ncbi:aldo-keto reductase family 1 member D1 isoform X3 [Dromiciops gliroides]|uniref:aldo-keto reductase family 1 member D1 isoform X3 n=1 Tax=Dromiciops gliroides TaxID=33562 RepID=UPI001CC6B205|nr:aldo-keto reductase family 1 member D1 isoform X3 [Dromiciops gliroides]